MAKKVLLDDQQDDDLELDDLEDEDAEDEDEDENEDAEEGAEDSDSDGSLPPEKRVKKLQSIADKATARANKLEKELEKLQKAQDGTGSEGSKDPERQALEDELREDRLDSVFAEFEELKSYRVSRDAIEGRTRAEMRDSAAQLVGLIKRVETRTRNRVLKERGLTADATGATRGTPKNYANMSDEDFEKELARGKSGGAPSLW